jgi:20S proteasome subunit alpha 6
VGIKGKDMKGIDSFKLFDGQEVRQWIEMAAEEKESGEGADAETAAAGESMEVDS